MLYELIRDEIYPYYFTAPNGSLISEITIELSEAELTELKQVNAAWKEWQKKLEEKYNNTNK